MVLLRDIQAISTRRVSSYEVEEAEVPPLMCAPFDVGRAPSSYGKPPFLMGKSTISIAIFHSYVTNYQRVIYNVNPGFC